MAQLKFITRGEQTAQGKQKAYFCAHPDDYGRYFEKVSGEILDTLTKENNRNCALFYLEDANAERDEDFRFSFKEMNLIIMPVTDKLLTTENPAIDMEFRLAKENGIHTAVDTAGHIPFQSFEKILPYTDLFLYDIKCWDSQTHKKFIHIFIKEKFILRIMNQNQINTIILMSLQTLDFMPMGNP